MIELLASVVAASERKKEAREYRVCMGSLDSRSANLNDGEQVKDDAISCR